MCLYINTRKTQRIWWWYWGQITWYCGHGQSYLGELDYFISKNRSNSYPEGLSGGISKPISQ